MNTDRIRDDRVTERAIGCAMIVSNKLGIGFAEKTYERALVLELGKTGLRVDQQKTFRVLYDGVPIGDHAIDLLVNETVILELKAARAIDSSHQAQLLNYLRVTGLRTGLILNFGTTKLGIKRMVL
jgi:GxxExxY protein